MTEDRRCIFAGCVATWRHWHGGFPDDDPDPTAVRDYNGAALRGRGTEGGQVEP